MVWHVVYIQAVFIWTFSSFSPGMGGIWPGDIRDDSIDLKYELYGTTYGTKCGTKHDTKYDTKCATSTSIKIQHVVQYVVQYLVPIIWCHICTMLTLQFMESYDNILPEIDVIVSGLASH